MINKGYIFLIIFLMLVSGCEKKRNPEEQTEFNRSVDSLLFNTLKTVVLDTTGIYKSPIKIISAKYISDDYSDYRNVQLKYKNVSTKTVEAIRFEWYGENAFGEMADNGQGHGVSDETIKPNQTRIGVWEVRSRDGKKIILAKPYEVVFSDGSKWKLNEL